MSTNILKFGTLRQKVIIFPISDQIELCLLKTSQSDKLFRLWTVQKKLCSKCSKLRSQSISQSLTKDI